MEAALDYREGVTSDNHVPCPESEYAVQIALDSHSCTWGLPVPQRYVISRLQEPEDSPEEGELQVCGDPLQETLFILKQAKRFGTKAGDVYQVIEA